MNNITNNFNTTTIIAIAIGFLLFILQLLVCFAIISMSNSLKDIRNLYFRTHWEDVKKARKEDAIEKHNLDTDQ